MPQIPPSLLIAAVTLSACSDDSEPPPSRTYRPEVGVQHLTANGIDIAYLESGSGPLVILLHGFPDTPHTWADLRVRLVDAGYRTVAPFLRGYAPSEILPTDDYAVVTLGQDLVAFIEALGEERAIVIGHDWGATASYAAANSAPTRIDRLVTLAIPHPLAFATHPDALEASPHFQELIAPDAVTTFSANDFQGVDQLYARWSPTWELPAGELEPVKNTFSAEGCVNAAIGYYRAFDTAPLDPILFQATTVPTLTFYGSADGAGDPSVFADHANGFTTPPELIELPTGHFIHREAPSEVADQILAFLETP